MPTYPVIHKETGEKQELSMSMLKYDEWRKENPDWDKDWSEGCAGIGEVGDWQNKLIQKNPGWNDVLRKAGKAPGAVVKPIT
tara:strand:+ start:213 stop:458 length:246 start_codon:yes stop_codon:yes gene_type:complete